MTGYQVVDNATFWTMSDRCGWGRRPGMRNRRSRTQARKGPPPRPQRPRATCRHALVLEGRGAMWALATLDLDGPPGIRMILRSHSLRCFAKKAVWPQNEVRIHRLPLEVHQAGGAPGGVQLGASTWRLSDAQASPGSAGTAVPKGWVPSDHIRPAPRGTSLASRIPSRLTGGIAHARP